MTILSEIQKWAEKLPAWQQHAVAVLYERPTPMQGKHRPHRTQGP